jgi:hypothetical protein
VGQIADSLCADVLFGYVIKTLGLANSGGPIAHAWAVASLP